MELWNIISFRINRVYMFNVPYKSSSFYQKFQIKFLFFFKSGHFFWRTIMIYSVCVINVLKVWEAFFEKFQSSRFFHASIYIYIYIYYIIYKNRKNFFIYFIYIKIWNFGHYSLNYILKYIYYPCNQ